MRTEYTFRHEMHAAASPGQVAEVLLDLGGYPEWWREVRAVASLGPDDALVLCRSVLPYDLELHLHAVSRGPEVCEVAIDGPISGFARWTLHDLGDDEGPGRTRLEFEQVVRAEARLFVLGSYLMKPALAWNHARMMRGAEKGLAVRLRRVARRG